MNYINLFKNEKGKLVNLGEEPLTNIHDAVEEIESFHVNNGIETFCYIATIQFDLEKKYQNTIYLMDEVVS